MDALQLREKVAKFIVVNRIKDGLTQSNIASKTSRTFQQIQKYENCVNGVASDTLLFICKAFGYDMHYLLNGKPEQLLSQLKPTELQKAKKKFQEIEKRIEQQRLENERYQKMLPQLEAEMSYVVTFKDPT